MRPNSIIATHEHACECIVCAHTPQELRLRHREHLRRERKKIGLLTGLNCRKCAKKSLKSLRNVCDAENENSAKRAGSRMHCFCARPLQRYTEGIASAGGASEKIEIFRYIGAVKSEKNSPHIPQIGSFLLFKTVVVRRA